MVIEAVESVQMAIESSETYDQNGRQLLGAFRQYEP
jgi:hypothetical protein